MIIHTYVCSLNILHMAQFNVTYLTERVLMEPVTTIRMEMKILNWLESVLHILMLGQSQMSLDDNLVLFTLTAS